ncbi:hypothetical protein [Erythrobacter alti]|uniref:hypothetical protein n=1 Tax=Erythrobacter alti TaxID=1896145 RepID=UPI0030F3F664
MKKIILASVTAAFALGLTGCAEEAEAPAEEADAYEATADVADPAMEGDAMMEDEAMMEDDGDAEVEAVINPDGDAGGPIPAN